MEISTSVVADVGDVLLGAVNGDRWSEDGEKSDVVPDRAIGSVQQSEVQSVVADVGLVGENRSHIGLRYVTDVVRGEVLTEQKETGVGAVGESASGVLDDVALDEAAEVGGVGAVREIQVHEGFVQEEVGDVDSRSGAVEQTLVGDVEQVGVVAAVREESDVDGSGVVDARSVGVVGAVRDVVGEVAAVGLPRGVFNGQARVGGGNIDAHVSGVRRVNGDVAVVEE